MVEATIFTMCVLAFLTGLFTGCWAANQKDEIDRRDKYIVELWREIMDKQDPADWWKQGE